MVYNCVFVQENLEKLEVILNYSIPKVILCFRELCFVWKQGCISFSEDSK